MAAGGGGLRRAWRRWAGERGGERAAEPRACGQDGGRGGEGERALLEPGHWPSLGLLGEGGGVVSSCTFGSRQPHRDALGLLTLPSRWADTICVLTRAGRRAGALRLAAAREWEGHSCIALISTES